MVLKLMNLPTRALELELDLLIGDVVNKIGNLSPEITAVNFGQAKSSSADTMENTAAALCNMVGEVIGTCGLLKCIVRLDLIKHVL